MAEKSLHIGPFSFIRADFVRISVITSLVVSSTLITIFSFHFDNSFITTQILCIPVIYTSSTYPKRGIIIAGICGNITLKSKVNVGIDFRQEVPHDT